MAGHIHITQPAVSDSLVEIERLLEVPLFERGSRGLTPTVYGECVVRHARSIISGFRNARDELMALRSGGSGSVTVATLPAAATQLVPQAILRLKQRASGTTVVLREGTLGEMLVELRGERLYLIAGPLPHELRDPGFEALTLQAEDQVVCVTGHHHALARAGAPAWRELTQYPWIFPPEKHLGARGAGGVAGRRGTGPTPRPHRVGLDRCQPTPAARVEPGGLHVAQQRRGPQRARADPHPGVELPQLSGPIGALWLKKKALSPAASALLDALGEVAAAMERRAAQG